MADKDRKNFVFYMKLLFSLLLLMLALQLVYFSVVAEQRIATLKENENLLYNKNKDYLQISNLYSLFFKIEYFKRYPKALAFINPKLDADEVIKYYMKEIALTV